MAIFNCKIVCLLLLGIGLAKAAPAHRLSDFGLHDEDEDSFMADVANADEIYDAAEDEALMDSRLMEFDVDSTVAEAGRRGPDPSFWNTIKKVAIGAGKSAAKSLAQSGLQALQAHNKRAGDDDVLFDKIAAVANDEFQAMGKRMVKDSLQLALREADAYGNPGFFSAIKNGASRVWNTVKPIAKEIGRKVAGVVASHLNSYAHGRRSPEGMEQLARDVSAAVRRAALSLAQSATETIQDTMRSSNAVHPFSMLYAVPPFHPPPVSMLYATNP